MDDWNGMPDDSLLNSVWWRCLTTRTAVADDDTTLRWDTGWIASVLADL